jgi:hypothetical protein
MKTFLKTAVYIVMAIWCMLLIYDYGKGDFSLQGVPVDIVMIALMLTCHAILDD